MSFIHYHIHSHVFSFLSVIFKKESKFLELHTPEGTHWDSQVVCCFLSIAIPVHSAVARAMCLCQSECTHVWCLVVWQFDQSADAKVWRAKWPLHSQTHTATANLETLWKIISSVCMLWPADLLETGGEERKGGTDRLKLASRLKHYKTTNISPRGWFKYRSVCSFWDMCYLIANYSVRKIPHSHTNKPPKTNTNLLKDKTKRKANKRVRRAACERPQLNQRAFAPFITVSFQPSNSLPTLSQWKRRRTALVCTQTGANK